MAEIEESLLMVSSVSTPQHLVVIRGNSGSGKTTLARDLQLAMGRGTANIGQDHVRRVILREHDRMGGDNIGLIAQTVRYCLAMGYHVIVEGILYSDHYRSMLCELIDEHAGPSHVFYLDVSLDETLRRHASRPMAAEVGPRSCAIGIASVTCSVCPARSLSMAG